MTVDGHPPGEQILRAALWGTALFVVACVAMAAVPEVAVAAGVAVSFALFLAGSATFLVGFLRAVERSRTEEVHLAGLFFLAGTAPRRTRVMLLGALALQVVAAVAAASVRPFTPVAFATLAPVYGLGLTALWGARHARFPRRRPPGTAEASSS
ncbi:MAG: hypothetical protein FJW83_08120 [Actinobacteria bacterium]|nr:hypothetical protein [Actinomycetota bacterium]